MNTCSLSALCCSYECEGDVRAQVSVCCVLCVLQALVSSCDLQRHIHVCPGHAGVPNAKHQMLQKEVQIRFPLLRRKVRV